MSTNIDNIKTCFQSIQRQYSADLSRTGILSGCGDRSLELRGLDNGSALIEILYSLEKLNFFKGAEGLGEQSVPQLDSAVVIHF